MPNNLPNNANLKKVSPTRPSRPTFEKYVDPEGELTAQKFKFDLWYVKNKVLLFRLSIISLIVFSLINFVYSIGTFGNYLLFGVEVDKNLSVDSSYFPSYDNINSKYTAAPLQVVEVSVLPSSKGKVDLIAEIANPNDKFLVLFDFYFTVGGVDTKIGHSFILPGTTNLITILGFDSGSSGSGASIAITNVQWQRISGHEIIDTVGWQKERLNFVASNLEFTGISVNPESPNANVIRFKIFNNSSYSYKNAGFLVGLYRDQALVGVAPLLLDEFNSQELKEIDLRNVAENLYVNQIKLYPQINVYNSEVFLPPPH